MIQACNIYAGAYDQTSFEEQKLTGHYIYGHEANTFQPCGQKNLFWIIGSEAILQYLEQKYTAYTSQPYEEVYIEITGDYVGKAQDGFAMDYHGKILITKILRMKKKSKNDCK